MIFLFLSSLVFSVWTFDAHPAIIKLTDTFSAEKVCLKQIFGQDNKLLEACLDAATGKITSVLEKWKELNKKFKADKKLIFSQGYKDSSAYEFFCSICLVCVHPAANNFFVFFDTNYEQFFKNKSISPSLLMLLSVLTDNPFQTLHIFKNIFDEIPHEEPDPIKMFGLFCVKCSQKFGSKSLLVQYMDDDSEEGTEEETEEENNKALEAARRLKIEHDIIKRFQNLMIASQADRSE